MTAYIAGTHQRGFVGANYVRTASLYLCSQTRSTPKRPCSPQVFQATKTSLRHRQLYGSLPLLTRLTQKERLLRSSALRDYVQERVPRHLTRMAGRRAEVVVCEVEMSRRVPGCSRRDSLHSDDWLLADLQIWEDFVLFALIVMHNITNIRSSSYFKNSGKGIIVSDTSGPVP